MHKSVQGKSEVFSAAELRLRVIAKKKFPSSDWLLNSE